MPKYYGSPCEGCGKPLMLTDDIVVCPDCGAPYHRVCYEKLGRCIHSAAHRAGFEWKFPYQDSELRTCPACGERTLRAESVCRCCGKVLPPEGKAEPNDRAAANAERGANFDYASFYAQQQQQQPQSPSDMVHQTYQAVFGRDGLMDGISYSDWEAYIGSAAPSYMLSFSKMQLQRFRISISFSAMLFGPFYFFYRKAWKPAFAFLAAEVLLCAPSIISMMQISGSSLAPGMSEATLLTLGHVASALNFVLMLVRGLYGKWLYRKSAEGRIKQIRTEFPDPAQRRAVLSAQGGVSLAAVFGAFMLLLLIGSAASMLLGPNIDALATALYG